MRNRIDDNILGHYMVVLPRVLYMTCQDVTRVFLTEAEYLMLRPNIVELGLSLDVFVWTPQASPRGVNNKLYPLARR